MDLQLTQNNHFKFGYDNKYFLPRQFPEQKWNISYGSINRATKDWKSECLIAAQQIANSTKKRIYVCFSGGIDSEVVMESFRLATIPITAAIIRLKDKINDHDIFWAEKYCIKNNIPIEYFDVDIFEFYKTEEYQKIINSTQCFYPMLSLQMKIMEWVAQKGGFPVAGSAECYIEQLGNQQWVLFEREIFASLYRYQILKNFEGVCGFYQWSPEIMYSFLTDPFIKKLIGGEFPNKKNSLEIKQDIYAYYFKTEARPKYYGWEKFATLEEQMRRELLNKFSYARAEITTTYQTALKILNAKAF